MEHTIYRLLEKGQDLRNQHAADLRAELKRLKRASEPRATTAAVTRPARRCLWPLIAAVVLPALVGLWTYRNWMSAPPVAGGKAVAVTYFTNLSQDKSLDWLDRGLCEMLTTNLSQVKGIDVLSSEHIAPGCMTEACAGPTKIIRGDPRQSELRGIFLHNVPDNLVCYAVAPHMSGSAYTPKNLPAGHTSCGHPFINGVSGPVRDWNSPDMATFANQIDYCPMVVPKLKVIDRQIGKFTAAEPATQQDHQNRAIAFTF